MLRSICISMLGLTVILAGQVHTDESTTIEAQSISFDTQCIGSWPAASVWSIAHDAKRDLLFLGSCGCVYILDVSDPTQPRKISEIRHSSCNTCGVFYHEHTQRIYICSGITGLSIWDVTDPSRPRVLSRNDTPGYACGVYVAGSFAYLVDGDAGFLIIDVSAPAHPREVSHLEMDAACCVYVQDQYAYVADLGLRIIDISDPLHPVEKAYHETPGVAYDVQVVGDCAYVADDWEGLRVIDISDKENPHEIGYLTIPGFAWNVHVKDSFAYVSACDAGLFVIDVADPADPRIAMQYSTISEIMHAYVSDSYFYAATAMNGLQIFAHRSDGRRVTR